MCYINELADSDTLIFDATRHWLVAPGLCTQCSVQGVTANRIPTDTVLLGITSTLRKSKNSRGC